MRGSDGSVAEVLQKKVLGLGSLDLDGRFVCEDHHLVSVFGLLRPNLRDVVDGKCLSPIQILLVLVGDVDLEKFVFLRLIEDRQTNLFGLPPHALQLYCLPVHTAQRLIDYFSLVIALTVPLFVPPYPVNSVHLSVLLPQRPFAPTQTHIPSMNRFTSAETDSYLKFGHLILLLAEYHSPVNFRRIKVVFLE